MQGLAKLSSLLNTLGRELMGEEVFQLHAATSTYATHPMSLYKASHEKKLNKVFFHCLYLTESSFPTGALQGFLSLLMLYKFPTS